MKHSKLLTTFLLTTIALLLPQMAGAYSFLTNGIAYEINPDQSSVYVTYTQLNSANNYSGLTTATIPSSVSYGGNTYSVTGIGDNAFAGCSGMTSVSIGSSVKTIGSNAFSGCIGLKSLNTGTGVTTIGNNAFENCGAMTTVTIGNSVTAIGNYAFKGCSGMTTVNVGTAVETIGKDAFDGCTALTKVKINSIPAWCDIDFHSSLSNPLYYAKNLYLGSTLKTELIIPNTVNKIKQYAFYGCSSLTSLTIGTAVTSIGTSAFTGCSGLTTVNWNATNCADFSYDNRPFYELSNISTFIFGSTVTKIPAYLCYYLSGLTSVTIGNSVTEIGDNAFDGCSGLSSVNITDLAAWCNIDFYSYNSNPLYYAHNLYLNGSKVTNLVIPSSVTTIKQYAFIGCSGLTSVTIGNSVTSIGSSAFYGCSGLTSVNITDLAAWCNIDFGDNPLSYAHNLYLNGSKVTNLVIPSSVTTIKTSAFSGFSGMTSVTIPNSVTSIGSSAFSGCSGLTSVTIGNSVTSIGNSAFYGCSGLTSVTIPNSVTTIGSGAFQSCSGLTSVTIPNSVTSIGDYAFSGSGLTSVNITDLAAWCNIDFYSYDSNPLYYAHNLYLNGSKVTNLVIPSSVTTIKKYAFSGCSGLTSLTIPNSVTTIGGGAFASCSGLTSVTIGNSVTSIGNSAFYGCSGLTSVTIPNSVTTIGSGAFQRCSGLTSVTIPNSVTSIGNEAFYGCSGLTSVNITDLAAWCNIDFYSYDSNPLSNAHNLYLNGSKVTNLVIPSSVTTIKKYAFSGCSGLTSVTIPNSVTSIGSSAFSGCSGLTTVAIGTFDPVPNPVASIGEYAFEYCTNLASVTIGNSVSSIGRNAFSYCSGLTSVTIPNSVTAIGEYAFNGTAWYNNQPDGLVYAGMVAYKYKGEMPLGTSIVLKDECTGVADVAFNDCYNLTSITMGNSVKAIGIDAFSGCSGLTSVTFGRSVRTIGNGAFERCYNIKEIYCCSTIPPGIIDYDDYGTFDNSIYNTCVLYIPRGTSLYYSLSYGWSAFLNVVEWDPALAGDANEDGTLNIGDYMTTASYILERNPQPFNFDAADIDGNDIIDVNDLVAIAGMALNYQSAPRQYAPAIGMDDARVAMNAVVAEQNTGNYSVSINLDNTVDVTAMQMDFQLPEGMTMVEATLCDRAHASHQVQFSQLASGDYRVLISSSANKTFSGNDGKVLTLSLAGKPCSNGIVRNIILASPNNTGYNLEDIELLFETTGVDDIRSLSKIYSDGYNIIIDSPTSGVAQFVLPNGMSQAVNVQVGHNVYPSPATGLVIVKMNDKVVKLFR